MTVQYRQYQPTSELLNYSKFTGVIGVRNINHQLKNYSKITGERMTVYTFPYLRVTPKSPEKARNHDGI